MTTSAKKEDRQHMKKLRRTVFAGLFLCLLILAGSVSVHAEIHFDRASVNVLKGKTRKVRIFCKGKYSIATTNKSVATVTHSGKVKGKRAGNCEIVVTCGTESARIPVHVLRSLRAGDILFVGHRGDQKKYPENTIPSFMGALNYGADGVEFDVHLTNSGDLFVFHDRSLSRMCGKPGDIQDLTEKTRADYPVTKNKKRALIPTLEETLRYLKSRNAVAFIHLKNASRFIGRGTDLVVQCIRACGMEEQSVVFNSNYDAILYFHTHYPEIQSGYCYSGSSLSEAHAAMRHASDCGASWFYFFDKNMISYSNIQFAHQCGLKAGLYRTRKKSEIFALLDYGADFTMMYRRLI